MTKNEAYDIIETAIYNSIGVDPDTGEILFPNNKQMGYAVLNALIDAGFLPPKAWIITNPNNSNFPELANEKELVNEWEEE